MNFAKPLALGFVSSMLLSLVACSGGAGPASGFKNSPPPGEDPPAGGDTSSAGGGFGGSGGSSGNPAPSAPAGDMAMCATSTAAAVPKPVFLVFAYDQSGSMAGDGKWTAAGLAMKAFFTSTGANGLNASLTFFPKYESYPLFCDSGEYSDPDVAMTTLPSPAFGNAIDATAPQPGKGGTPTVAALSGTMGYAQQVQGSIAKDATVALVMVTDGIPEVCSDKGDVGPASLVAAANASTIPTYVVGVGDQLSNLNTIAAAGGTKSAFVVSVGDPTKTQADLTEAINTIKTSALSCDYKIPSPPNGETFDPKKVNVQFTPASGAATALDYDQSCSAPNSWRYDDANNPTRIVACDSTCNSIKSSGGKVDIVFGCATHDAPPVK